MANNQPKCACRNCSFPGVVKIEQGLNRRGGRVAYLCSLHAHEMAGYNYESNAERGTEKVNPYTYGIELETMRPTLKARTELAAEDFTPTSDCTVDVEFKSPVFQGLNAPIKFASSIQRLMDDGDITIDNHCGTHVNVGIRGVLNEDDWPIGPVRKAIADFYRPLYEPLTNAMLMNTGKTVALFGRHLGGTWAQVPNWASPYNHSNWVNLEHGNRIEYRLPRFTSAEQFKACLRFCKKLTEILNVNFIAHLDDTDWDKRRYPSEYMYRKHLAIITGNKMVKAFEKVQI